ncbi:tetratricopeptide repeat protein [Roseateles sp. DB2]|uniref:tetratricopeptide repeat protein n=1 Tax=Roseateles sp. DB2 TaxID=3453717 RepID=UPI003EEE773A
MLIPQPPACEQCLDLARQALAEQRMRDTLVLLDQARGTCDLDALPAALRCEIGQMQARAGWALYDLRQAYVGASLALSHLPAQARIERVEMLDIASLCLSGAGLMDEALEMAREAVELATRPPQLHPVLPRALGALAHVCAQLGQYDEAEMLHMQALSRARESQEPHAMTRAYTNALLAGALAIDELRRRGHDLQADAMGQRQLRLAFQARSQMDAPEMNQRQRSSLLLNIGIGMMHGGRLSEAQALFEAGQALIHQDELPHAWASLQHAQGECALLAGDLDRARILLEPLLLPEALQAYPFMRAPLLRNALRLYEASGEAARAAQFMQRLQELEEDQARQRRQVGETLRALRRQTPQWLSGQHDLLR